MNRLTIVRSLAPVLALTLATSTALAQPAPSRPLEPELQTAVRCAALFSIVAADQARKAPGSAQWPPLALRGREFFVRVGAKVMDSAGLDRAGVQALMRSEVTALRAAPGGAAVHATALRAPCLAMLDTVVPASR